ncbi:MAG: hypothetical protein H6741_00890 [Alphaproteobacteria bacterium]|nr:hypothetical protein [Alphaproteobacteria bacterium]
MIAAVLAFALVLALHHPVLGLAGSHVPDSAFHPGHAWLFDHVARVLSGERPASLVTDRLAWPVGAELRPIAWGPALLAAPLRALLGPIGAYNLVVWLSPALSVLATAGLLRRVTPAGPWEAAAAALPFALSPFALGCLASGQVAKLQLWCLSLPLWAVASLLEGERRGPATLALAASVLLASFTSPSLTLQLPFALGVLVLLWAGRSRARWALGGWVLLIAAAAMLPAWSFYSPVTEGHPLDGPVQALQPALRPTLDKDIARAVARIPTTLWPAAQLPQDPTDTPQVTVLPWPLLLATLALVAARLRARALARPLLLGLSLTIVGVLLASGEFLYWGEQPVTVAGRHLGLPALYLGELGYPLGSSGMYYRAIATATLGLSVLLAAGAARLPGRWGPALAGLIALGSVGEAVRVTAPLWPRPPAETLDPALSAEMAADPVPGAVLDFPLVHHGNRAERYMLASVSHGRSTNGAPLLLRPEDLPYLAQLVEDVEGALVSTNPARALSQMGVRWVVWHPISCDGGPDRVALEAALGPPRELGEHAVWQLP